MKQYTTFGIDIYDTLKEPMFFGHNLNIARYDQQKHPIFESLTEKQLSFFWRPEEIDLTRDRTDFQQFTEAEKHIFFANLKYQILLDSIQSRSPNVSLLPLVSLPELETYIATWTFSETIHSRSYTHIIRSLIGAPHIIFDNLLLDKDILKRSYKIASYYDEVILLTQLLQSQGSGIYNIKGKVVEATIPILKKALFLLLHVINALEAIRFYVSFACTFAFAENRKMEGCSKIMKLIARDEALHCTGTQHMINIILKNKDGDSELSDIANSSQEEAQQIFLEVVAQEKAWAKYLFQVGHINGLNEYMLCEYVDYLASIRMPSVGLIYDLPRPDNPLLWMNSYLHSDNVQVAPQEVEVSSYLVGQIDSNIDHNAFRNFKL